jgi:hypothetical protein
VSEGPGNAREVDPAQSPKLSAPATFDVLQRAAASGANLIVSHEPTFYGHLDQIEPGGIAIVPIEELVIPNGRLGMTGSPTTTVGPSVGLSKQLSPNADG